MKTQTKFSTNYVSFSFHGQIGLLFLLFLLTVPPSPLKILADEWCAGVTNGMKCRVSYFHLIIIIIIIIF